jgi:hypothetical protein
VCARKPEVLRQCMRKAEQATRAREAAEAKERELERQRAAEEERAMSDEMLAWGAEFWGTFGGDMAEGMAAAAYAALEAEAAPAEDEVFGVAAGEAQSAADPEELDPAELETEAPPAVAGATDGLGIEDVDWHELAGGGGDIFDDDVVEDFDDEEDVDDGNV